MLVLEVHVDACALFSHAQASLGSAARRIAQIRQGVIW